MAASPASLAASAAALQAAEAALSDLRMRLAAATAAAALPPVDAGPTPPHRVPLLAYPDGPHPLAPGVVFDPNERGKNPLLVELWKLMDPKFRALLDEAAAQRRERGDHDSEAGSDGAGTDEELPARHGVAARAHAAAAAAAVAAAPVKQPHESPQEPSRRN